MYFLQFYLFLFSCCHFGIMSFFYLYCFFNLYLLYVLIDDDDLYNLNHNMVASCIDHTFEIYKRPSK